jgi:phosphoglucosamine mutase
MMEVMCAKKMPLSKLCEPFKVYPQVLINVKVADKVKAQQDEDVLAAVKSVEDKLGNSGRILYRASGTEQLIRIMVEAESEKICKKYAKEVESVLREKGHVV